MPTIPLTYRCCYQTDRPDIRLIVDYQRRIVWHNLSADPDALLIVAVDWRERELQQALRDLTRRK